MSIYALGRVAGTQRLLANSFQASSPASTASSSAEELARVQGIQTPIQALLAAETQHLSSQNTALLTQTRVSAVVVPQNRAPVGTTVIEQIAPPEMHAIDVQVPAEPPQEEQMNCTACKVFFAFFVVLQISSGPVAWGVGSRVGSDPAILAGQILVGITACMCCICFCSKSVG